MKRLENLERFDANNFFRVSLSAALNVAKEANLKEALTSEEFYKRVAKRVRAETDIPEELFHHLSHSIHWTIFRHDGYNSPLELVQTSADVGSFHVVQRRGIVESDLQNLTNYAHGQHSSYVQERVKKFSLGLVSV